MIVGPLTSQVETTFSNMILSIPVVAKPICPTQIGPICFFLGGGGGWVGVDMFTMTWLETAGVKR